MTIPNLHALLIGVDYYQPDPVPEARPAPASLKGCVRDVRAVEHFLTTRLAVPPDRIRKLTSTAPNDGQNAPLEESVDRPTYANMVRAFRDLTKAAARGDLVYIHYSGHGARAVTKWPDLKFEDPWDEGLVPYDIADPSAQYLRDLELGHLLRELVSAGLFVTLALDCCHSGGTARGPHARGVSVRSAGEDRYRRLAPSVVATDQELVADLRQISSVRSLAVGAGWVPASNDYILLAACRAHEYAYEFPFDGISNSGAFTYWMLDATRGLHPGVSCQDVYDRVLARVRAKFDRQTPLILGPGHRAFLGTDLIPVLPPAVTVLAVEGGQNRVRLLTGQALGVRTGTRFALYPQGVNPITTAASAVVEVEETGATESTAKITDRVQVGDVQVGDRAVQLGAATLRRKVRIDGDPKAADTLRQALVASGWLEEAGSSEVAEFYVSVATVAGVQSYVIADSAELPLSHVPTTAVGNRDAGRQVAGMLEHVARYRAVQEIENHNADSPLSSLLRIELLGRQRQYDPVDQPAPELFPTGTVPELSVGEWTFLCIRNMSRRVLNISALNLGPDWKVSLVFPAEGDLSYESLEPGEKKTLKLQANLPGGISDGVDVIKVFATVGPADFRALTLPALESTEQKGATRSDSAKRNSRGQAEPTELDRLFDALTADRPTTRTLIPYRSPGAEWTVASVTFRVVNPLGRYATSLHLPSVPVAGGGIVRVGEPPWARVMSPPVPRPLRIRVVFIAAQPDELNKTRTDEEYKLIREAWRGADNETRKPFELAEPRLAALPTDLLDALRESRLPTIVHYGGHGIDRAGLALEDGTGGTRPVTTDELREVFRAYQGQVWCVVLKYGPGGSRD